MFIENFKVESPNVKYTDHEIHSVYDYETTELVHENRNGTYQWIVKPKTVKYEFKTDVHVPKLGYVREKKIYFFNVKDFLFSLSCGLFWWVNFKTKFFHTFFYDFDRVMLVGWGGNNGSTLTGGVIANRE